MPAAENIITGVSDFSIYTAGMTVDPLAPESRPVVRMVGSSTEMDLHHDTMTVSALQDMVQKTAPGLLIWLNHDYTVPDSLFGSLCEPPMIKQHYGVADLHLAVDVEMQSEAAAKTYQFIKNNRRLGCSIGFSIEDYELRDSGLPKGAPGWDVPLVHITHVRPVEWSVVGVPANQRSWVENAIAGLWEKSLGDPAREDEAYRLAPVVKSLFPNKFRDAVKSLTKSGASADFVQYLKGVPSRAQVAERILWNPNSNTFLMTTGSAESSARALDTKSVTGVMERLYTKAIEPHLPPVSAPTEATKDEGGVLDSTSGEPMNRQDLDEKKGADDAAKKAQEARAKKYHISIKEGGNVTKPSEWESVPDSEWGDPTNYRYPMPDKSHADNAASRWGDASNRSQYSSEEQAIIGRRIEARQRHFGESDTSDKKGIEVNLISTEVFENGSRLLKYDDGSEVIETMEKAADGSETITQMTVKAGQPKPADPEKKPEGDDEEKKPEGDGDGDGDGDEKKPAKKPAKKPEGDDEDEGKEENDDDKADDGKKAGEADATTEVETPVEEPVVEQKSTDETVETEVPLSTPEMTEKAAEGVVTTPTLDPAKELLLRSYNQLGEALGLPAFTFEQKAAKAASGVTTAMRSLAKVIDDAADELLRELGVPDDDEAVEKGLDADTLALVRKSGAAISARNKKRLQLAHDVLADMAGGMHCADYVARQSDAPAAMQREEEKKDGADALETKGVGMSTVKVEVDGAAIAEQVIASFKEQVTGVSETLSGLDVKGLQTSFESLRTEAALARKGLEDLSARADAITQMMDELTEGRGLGRPTKMFTMRSAPQGDAKGVTDAAEATVVPQAQTLEEALTQTTVQYKTGVGMARKWATGIGKGLRPTLSAEQMTGMTIQEITNYYGDGEALVPIVGE